MLFQKPTKIQRLCSRSRDSQARFIERYMIDGFECAPGYLSRTLEAMHNNLETAEIDLHGIPIYVAWNPDKYDRDGAALVIDQLWNGGLLESRQESPTYFTFGRYQEQRGMEKQRRVARRQYFVNAWIDVEHGLFWTWEKINLKDLASNIAKTVEWLHKTPEERRAENFAGRRKPTLEAQLGPLKDQLIQAGKLSPRQ